MDDKTFEEAVLKAKATESKMNRMIDEIFTEQELEFTKSLDIEYEVIDCDADEYEVIDCDADEHHEEILKPEDPAEPETVEAFRAASTVSADVQRRIDQLRGLGRNRTTPLMRLGRNLLGDLPKSSSGNRQHIVGRMSHRAFSVRYLTKKSR